MLVAKRIYDGEIVRLKEATVPLAAATAKLREIAQFPDQAKEGDAAEGQLWIETEDADGMLVDDPICFPADAAHATLVRTGMAPEEATWLLSDAYAQQWLDEEYSHA